jgi:hypothetical protein
MISAEELLGLAGCASEVIDLGDGLGKVRARPLTYAEGIRFGELDSRGKAVLTLQLGLVEPALTEEQAQRFYDEAPFGALNALTTEILRLSGMLDPGAAQKSVGAEAPAGGG